MVAEEIRNLADRSAWATADIAGIIKALQEVAQEAVISSNDGLRIAEDSSRQAEDGMAWLEGFLRGVNEATQVVSQIARRMSSWSRADANYLPSARRWRRSNR